MELIADISWYWLLLWAFVSIGAAWWYYQVKGWLNDISSWKRYLLFGLRSLGLFLIGVLIAGIFFPYREYDKQKPMLLLVLDNSTSMLNYADSAEVKSETPIFINELKSKFSQEHEVVVFPSPTEDENKNILFDKKKSPISQWFNDVYANFYRRNVGAMVFISDGNYNQGMDPTTAAKALKNIPIYTIGVGDTVQKRDLAVAGLNHNNIAFLGNKFPVEVSIDANKVTKNNVKIWVEHQDKVLEEVSVNFEDKKFQTVKHTFYLEAKKVGIQAFTVHVEEVPNEHNYTNNSKTFYIEVLDARSKILLLAGAPHPDIATIKSTLIKDQNLDVESVTIKNLPSNLAIYDLIIWHQPGLNMTAEQREQLLNANKPLWLIIGTSTTAKHLQELKLPLVLQTTGKTDEVRASLNAKFNKFELSEKTKDALSNLPPLTTHYGNLALNATFDVLYFQQVGTVVKETPLFFFGNFNNQKIGITFGEGLWRWKFAEFQRNKSNDGINELISKVVQYLAVRSNTNRLRVVFPSVLAEDEPIRVSASFYNESYDPITTVDIALTLINEKEEKTNYNFLPKASNYTLDLGSLDAGRYRWEANTEHNKERFELGGSILVRKVELEAADTRANHPLLERIAQNSEGRFYQFENRNQLFDELANREDIATIAYETVTYKKPLDFLWILLAIGALFALEWIIRRYNGSY